jgi:hypothetical protein
MLSCQTHQFLFGFTEEGMIGAMDLRRDLRYLIDQEFILRNGNQEAVKTFCTLLAVKYDEIDFSKPLPKKLPTGIGPDIELGAYIACDICGDRLRLSDEEKLIAHNLFRMRLGGDENVEGLVPLKTPIVDKGRNLKDF